MESNKMKVYARDPFAIDPLPKAFYHPSPEKKLTQSQRATALSPSRLLEVRQDKHQYENDRVSPMDEIFLKGTNQFHPRIDQHETPDDVDFDETWPSSERPSSLSLTGLEEESPMNSARFQGIIDRFTNIKQTLNFAEKESPSTSPQRVRQPGSAKHGTVAHSDMKPGKPAKSRIPQRAEKKGAKRAGKEMQMVENVGKPAGSVLQRYIERFRNSAPMSREEREMRKQSSSKDFWWLSPSGGSSQSDSPDRAGQDDTEETPAHPPLTAENLNKYSQWEQKAHKRSSLNVVPESPSDKKTIELQERAERLLQKSTSTVLSTDPAVSTEGLGSNMSDMSSLEEYPYRPAFTAYTDRGKPAARQPERARVPEFKSVGLERQPEDDPLYQWRLRRKMEQAQERPTKTVHTFDFLSKSEKEKKVDEQLEEFKRKLAEKSGQHAHTKPTRVEFTPAPQAVQTEKSSQPVPEQSQQKPQIASPILHRTRTGVNRQTEIDPHLHLMCDLLPCPHQSSYQQQISHPSQPEAAKDPDHESFKRFLEAEKPDVERVKEKKICSDGEMAAHDAGKAAVDLECRKMRARHKETDSDSRNSKPKTVRIKDSEQDENIHKKHRKAKERGRDEEMLLSDDEDRYREEKPVKSERLPKPRQSSSPKIARRGVDEAIGQVVKDHLFSMSTSTVLSSVESLQPSASVERLPPASRPRMSSLPEQPDTQTEESDQSDGEFGEDHLLQMLRSQRTMYEQQLQEIDSLLEKAEAR